MILRKRRRRHVTVTHRCAVPFDHYVMRDVIFARPRGEFHVSHRQIIVHEFTIGFIQFVILVEFLLQIINTF